MTKNELFEFIKKFNKVGAILPDTVIDGLKQLDKEDHELFMLLVNYKNGKDFKNKLDNGEI